MCAGSCFFAFNRSSIHGFTAFSMEKMLVKYICPVSVSFEVSVKRVLLKF